MPPPSDRVPSVRDQLPIGSIYLEPPSAIVRMHGKAEFLATELVPQPNTTDTDCGICLQTLTDPVSLPCPCKFTYCRECVAAWVGDKGTCPTCRKAFFEKMTFEEFSESDQAPPFEDFDIPSNATWSIAFENFTTYVGDIDFLPEEYGDGDDTFIDKRVWGMLLLRIANDHILSRAFDNDPLTAEELAEFKRMVQGLMRVGLTLDGRRMSAAELGDTIFRLLEREVEGFDREVIDVLAVDEDAEVEENYLAVGSFVAQLTSAAWVLEGMYYAQRP